MEFFINGQPVEVQLEGEETVGDVLKSFQITCDQNNAAVIGIRVNGTQITPESFDEEAKKSLDKNDKFEFDVVTVDTIKGSFLQLSELFTSLSEKMEQVPVELQTGKNSQAAESIKEVAESIDEFCHIATLASLFPEAFSNTNIEGQNFKDFFNDFSPILLDFEQALQNNDTVLIGDLSEYEICPRLKAISAALKNM